MTIPDHPPVRPVPATAVVLDAILCNFSLWGQEGEGPDRYVTDDAIDDEDNHRGPRNPSLVDPGWIKQHDPNNGNR